MQPANSLWLVKTDHYFEVWQTYVVRAATAARAIEIVKQSLINVDLEALDDNYHAEATLISVDGSEEIILSDGDIA